jgi:hypothetical protein
MPDYSSRHAAILLLVAAGQDKALSVCMCCFCFLYYSSTAAAAAASAACRSYNKQEQHPSPALVAVGVRGIVAGAGVCNRDDHTLLALAGVGAIQ